MPAISNTIVSLSLILGRLALVVVVVYLIINNSSKNTSNKFYFGNMIKDVFSLLKTKRKWNLSKRILLVLSKRI